MFGKKFLINSRSFSFSILALKLSSLSSPNRTHLPLTPPMSTTTLQLDIRVKVDEWNTTTTLDFLNQLLCFNIEKGERWRADESWVWRRRKKHIMMLCCVFMLADLNSSTELRLNFSLLSERWLRGFFAAVVVCLTNYKQLSSIIRHPVSDFELLMWNHSHTHPSPDLTHLSFSIHTNFRLFAHTHCVRLERTFSSHFS